MRKFFSIITLIAGIFVVGAAHAECTSDQYAVGDSCYSCPANATCDGVNFNCDDGFYRNVAMCSACPPNSTCTSQTEFSCNPGSYLQDGVCNTCPDHATCAGGTEKFHCNDGWYNSGTLCSSCTGHQCDGERLICCAEGYYYHNGFQRCLGCNSLEYCPECTWWHSTCREGSYRDINGNCASCPTGYFCYFGMANETNKYDYCNVGYYRINDYCVRCPDGVECPGGKIADITCSAGLYKHSNGQCLPYAENDPGIYPNCNPGFYDNGTLCATCPKNSICTSATEFSCKDVNYYRDASQCNECPNNADCSDGVIKCYAGYYLENNQCVSCQSYNYCQNNTQYPCPEYEPDMLDFLLGDDKWLNPEYHPNNTVQLWNARGNESIYHCGVGYVHFVSDAAKGWYLNAYNPIKWNGTKYNIMVNTQPYYTSANSGYYLINQITIGGGQRQWLGWHACTNGPTNSTYIGAGAPDSNNCPWQCDDGYYRDGDTCTTCPAGMNCLGGTIVCPSGQYPDVSVCRTCTNKPEHSTYSGPGTPAGNDCAFTCDAGYYYNGTTCAQCEPGYYCPGDNERHACDDTGYSDTPGATVCKLYPIATNLNPDDVRGYYVFRDGLHTSIRTCYVEFKPRTLNHGSVAWHVCYIDSNLETYGVSSLCQTAYLYVQCDGGYYMNPPNRENVYLNINGLDNLLQNTCIPVGEKYYSPANDIKRYECPTRQTTTGSGVGADQAADCGVIWHIGGQEVRLRSERRTDPRFCVQINDDVFYADMTPISEGTHGNIRIEVNGIVYSVYNADLQ